MSFFNEKKERNLEIVKNVLLLGSKISQEAKKYGITSPRASQIIHRHCKSFNPSLYESLYHTNEYSCGIVNYKCLPYLSELRFFASEFGFKE